MMEQKTTQEKHDRAKYKLAASIKECMKTTPVDRITVKDIVEGSGLTRQTFYRNFLDKYDKEVQRLTNFPFGYRGVSFEYRGYEIRIKSFGTYNVFFTVDIAEKQVFVLRVLKDRQDWKTILGSQDEYHFE